MHILERRTGTCERSELFVFALFSFRNVSITHHASSERGREGGREERERESEREGKKEGEEKERGKEEEEDRRPRAKRAFLF
mgnify:CR=1 FL=1